MPSRLAFPLIGGIHQVFHTVPVAAALARRAAGEVTILAADSRTLEVARFATRELGAPAISFRLLDRAPLADRAARLIGRSSFSKLPLLRRNAKLFDSFDAIVVPECTSIALRKMGVRRPQFVCIPHGAGDRAVSFESRFRKFDLVLVAGSKTAERMIESGVAADRIKIIGYPKAELLCNESPRRPRLFRNDRPTVLYNPHFRESLSSIGYAKRIVQAFATREDFNLIVAPHIRALENASGRELRDWLGMEVPDQIHVDVGSSRLIDMTYTQAADIYLGDVSSQVYEFLLEPRPCVFLDAHRVDWFGSPDYAFWSLGEVVSPDGVMPAVRTAHERHRDFIQAQRAAAEATFARLSHPADTAASEIITHLQRGKMLSAHRRASPAFGADLSPIAPPVTA